MEIRSPEQSFREAAKAIGRPELHIHDLRRFATSRMAVHHVPGSDAWKLLGMETVSIFDRYNISGDDRLQRAAGMLPSVLGAEPERKVKGIR